MYPAIRHTYSCIWKVNYIFLLLFFKFPKNITWEKQKSLIDVTYNCSLNKKFPIKLSYQLNFLKKLLMVLEQSCAEVHDAVYESYCEVQRNVSKDCTQKYAFKHYVITSGVHLSLRESKSFVAEGTTGLCSWQASLALADFLMQHPYITKDKVILELGAGTGLCGLILLKMCKPVHLFLTDGSSASVNLMCENIKRNFYEILDLGKNKFKVEKQMVQCLIVPWDAIENINEIKSDKPDIVLAADVVYDDSCFMELAHAIDHVFQLKNNSVEMYLAATVRNKLTLENFLNIMSKFFP